MIRFGVDAARAQGRVPARTHVEGLSLFLVVYIEEGLFDPHLYARVPKPVLAELIS
jgi:hypothetical protein